MKWISIFFAAVIVVSCQTNDKKSAKPPLAIGANNDADDSSKFTTVQWLDSLKDFGSVKEGDKVDVVFRFRNTGDKPLIIQNVVAGCGCTVPERPEAPIMPGKEGSIKAVFNSSHQPPTVQKTITVTTNTKNGRYHQLYFIGEVKSN